MRNFTKHAESRLQQRSVAPFVAGLILDYGQRAVRHGAEVWFLTKTGRKALRRDLGNRIYRRIQDQLDIYVVEAEGSVVTVAKRLQRIRN